MLEGERVSPLNSCTSTIFIDTGLIYSEWGWEIFSLSMGGGLGKKQLRSTDIVQSKVVLIVCYEAVKAHQMSRFYIMK